MSCKIEKNPVIVLLALIEILIDIDMIFLRFCYDGYLKNITNMVLNDI